MVIVGINGRAGSGKSTFTEYLIQAYIDLTHHDGIAVIPFAKALKEMAASIGWNGRKDEKGRRLLQLLGTEVCRECIAEDYWIQKWSDSYIKALRMGNSFIIIDDIRFPNEAKFIKDLGGYLVKITGRAYDNVDSKHPSELELDNMFFHKFIYNDGTLQDLQAKAVSVVKGLINWTC